MGGREEEKEGGGSKQAGKKKGKVASVITHCSNSSTQEAEVGDI